MDNRPISRMSSKESDAHAHLGVFCDLNSNPSFTPNELLIIVKNRYDIEWKGCWDRLLRNPKKWSAVIALICSSPEALKFILENPQWREEFFAESNIENLRAPKAGFMKQDKMDEPINYLYLERGLDKAQPIDLFIKLLTFDPVTFGNLIVKNVVQDIGKLFQQNTNVSSKEFLTTLITPGNSETFGKLVLDNINQLLPEPTEAKEFILENGKRYPVLANHIFENKSLKNQVSAAEQGISRPPNILSRFCGAVAGGLVGALTFPFIATYSVVTKIYAHNKNDKALATISAIIATPFAFTFYAVPSFFYGLIRGVHRGSIGGLEEGLSIPVVLTDKNDKLFHKDWLPLKQTLADVEKTYLKEQNRTKREVEYDYGQVTRAIGGVLSVLSIKPRPKETFAQTPENETLPVKENNPNPFKELNAALEACYTDTKNYNYGRQCCDYLTFCQRLKANLNRVSSEEKRAILTGLYNFLVEVNVNTDERFNENSLSPDPNETILTKSINNWIESNNHLLTQLNTPNPTRFTFFNPRITNSFSILLECFGENIPIPDQIKAAANQNNASNKPPTISL